MLEGYFRFNLDSLADIKLDDHKSVGKAVDMSISYLDQPETMSIMVSRRHLIVVIDSLTTGFSSIYRKKSSNASWKTLLPEQRSGSSVGPSAALMIETDVHP